MELMSLCVAPEVNFFVTKLYDSMLASGSRIMVVRDTSITEATFRAVRELVMNKILFLPVVSRGFVVQVDSTTVPPKGTSDNDGQISNSCQLGT